MTNDAQEPQEEPVKELTVVAVGVPCMTWQSSGNGIKNSCYRLQK